MGVQSAQFQQSAQVWRWVPICPGTLHWDNDFVDSIYGPNLVCERVEKLDGSIYMCDG